MLSQIFTLSQTLFEALRVYQLRRQASLPLWSLHSSEDKEKQ